MLTAIFTTKAGAFPQEPSAAETEKAPFDTTRQESELGLQPGPDDVVAIIQSIVPDLPRILLEHDRIVATATAISTNVIAPVFRSKTFPKSVTAGTLQLLYALSKLRNSSKAWKKECFDGFNDPKFFSTPFSLVETGWLPLLKQWVSAEKNHVPDLISRLSPPTSAGIMFGVGASSARLEADQKTQLNLRRLAMAILAASEDTFVTNINSLDAKLTELMTATGASSPSSATRAEVYMVIRALFLTISPVHLSSLWPALNAELQSAISSILPGERQDVYNPPSILQACKLLDVLLTIAPEEFQLHEWLFITDTIDAVYKPVKWHPVALADQVSEELGSVATTPSSLVPVTTASTAPSLEARRRKPLLSHIDINVLSKEQIVSKVLRPFFSQLSIYTFESTYGMGEPDRQACIQGLLKDLFDESTIAG